MRKKKRKTIQQRNLTDALCESNILILFLKNMSHQKIYTFSYSLVNDELPATFSQTVEQIKNIQGRYILGVSKINDLALEEKQGD